MDRCTNTNSTDGCYRPIIKAIVTTMHECVGNVDHPSDDLCDQCVRQAQGCTLSVGRTKSCARFTKLKLWPIQQELLGPAGAEKVTVKVSALRSEDQEKAEMFERVAQRVVDSHIELFGLCEEMFKPGIQKLGFDNEFELNLTPMHFEHLFLGREVSTAAVMPRQKWWVSRKTLFRAGHALSFNYDVT